MYRERHERIAVAVAAHMEQPFAYVEKAMAFFDEALESDPAWSAEAVAERRAIELMEEAA